VLDSKDKMQNMNIEQMEQSFGTVSTVTITGGKLESPSRVVYCKKNQCLYVTDEHRICKLTTTGAMSVVAGSATPGYADAKGNEARFNDPEDIDVDAEGNVYVADAWNNSIRKITPDEEVSTVAGNGTEGFQNGPAQEASFSFSFGIAVSNTGIIYVTDMCNHSVRTISDGIVSTLAGNGTPGFKDGCGQEAEFKYPRDIVLKSEGSSDVYVADGDNHAIRKINPGGEVETVAGNGEAGMTNGKGGDARFNEPSGLCVGSDGTVYVADSDNNVIRMMEPDGTVSTLAGTGEEGSRDGERNQAMFECPFGLTMDNDGFLYVVENSRNSIRIIDVRAKELKSTSRMKRTREEASCSSTSRGPIGKIAKIYNESREAAERVVEDLLLQIEGRDDEVKGLEAKTSDLQSQLAEERRRTADSRTKAADNMKRKEDEINRLTKELHVAKKVEVEKAKNELNNIKRKDDEIDRLLKELRAVKEAEVEKVKNELSNAAALEDARSSSVGQCVICFDRRREVIFLPCAHCVCCNQCWEVEKARSSSCPCCKQAVAQDHTVLFY